MQTHKQDFFDTLGDANIEDDQDVKRMPLLMVPKNNDFDPKFPANCYRLGKYVTIQQAKQQQNLQHISKTLYDKCVQQNRQDLVACYKQKVAIFRTILNTMRFGSSKYKQTPVEQKQ